MRWLLKYNAVFAVVLINFLLYIAKLYNETEQSTIQLKYFGLMFRSCFLKFLLQ